MRQELYSKSNSIGASGENWTNNHCKKEHEAANRVSSSGKKSTAVQMDNFDIKISLLHGNPFAKVTSDEFQKYINYYEISTMAITLHAHEF